MYFLFSVLKRWSMFVAVEQNNITSLNPDHHRQVAVEKQWQEGRSSLIYI